MRVQLFIIILMFAVSQLSKLHADVIITRDGMILNGKILEDRKPDNVIFANNHGKFTIKYNQIKEIHKTESFQGDIKYLQNIGKTVNEDDIKRNYESGEKRLEEQRQESSISNAETPSYILMSGIFFNKTSGELKPVLPYYAGIFFSAEIPLSDISFLKALNVYGLEGLVNYLYSSGENRIIKGISALSGPVWKFPIGIADITFKVSTLLGAGWFSVENNETGEKSSAAKWGLSFQAGPVFKISTIVLSPELKIDYVHDGAAPLAGAGLSFGAGYSF
jgi:hypothetical protein